MCANEIYTTVKISPFRIHDPRTNGTAVVGHPPNGWGNWCESILCLILLLLCFSSFRRLFKFIYVKIKLNASRNRSMMGTGTAVKLRSGTARMCESLLFFLLRSSTLLFSANTIACWINFETASQSQTISMADKHTWADAYALNGAHRLHKYINLITGRVSSISSSRFGVSADCWMCVCVVPEHHRANDTHKNVSGFFALSTTFRVCAWELWVWPPLK